MKEISDEDKEKYSFGDYWLIQNQILLTNIKRIVWQTVRIITNENLGVKGLTGEILEPTLPTILSWLFLRIGRWIPVMSLN